MACRKLTRKLPACAWNLRRSSPQDPFHHIALHFRQAHVATGVAEGELGMFKAEEVEDGGVPVVDVDGVDDAFVAELVGLAVAVAGFHAATGEPSGVAGVVSAICDLRIRGAAKLSGEDDERVFEQAALFEIGEKARDGRIQRWADRRRRRSVGEFVRLDEALDGDVLGFALERCLVELLYEVELAT